MAISRQAGRDRMPPIGRERGATRVCAPRQMQLPRAPAPYAFPDATRILSGVRSRFDQTFRQEKSMDRRFRWLAVALTCALAGTAHAQALTGTLKKIKDTGIVSLGIRESSVPFSYSDNQQKNIGYSRDIAARIIDALKAELKAPNLTVKEIPITSQNRIPLLQNGTIDFECGSTTNTLERQKQAAFSNSIFLYGICSSQTALI
jgi:hypothetical protein